MRYRWFVPVLAFALQLGVIAAPTSVPGGVVFSLGKAGADRKRDAPMRFSAREITDAKTRAELGMIDAQYNLGVMYTVNSRFEAAAHWFRKAALRGNREAAYNYGVLLLNGQGQPRDESKAAMWLERSAERGLPEAQYLLGRLYFDGRGVEADPAAEAAWYRKAAESGYPLAQHELGVLFHLGEGVPRDPVEAYAWFGAADANGLDSRDALAVLAAELEPTARVEARTRAERYADSHPRR